MFIINFFREIVDTLDPEQKIFVSVILYTVFIVIYSGFIWKFYRFLSSKDIIKLNLKKYNNAVHSGIEKFLAVILYTLEYIIVLPFLVLFWFTVLSLFLLVLSDSQALDSILMISAAIIASTRIAAYISEDLSKDLAKILPFTVLAMFLLGEDFFNLNELLTKISTVPSLFSHILLFLVFVFFIELILRISYSFILLFHSDSSE